MELRAFLRAPVRRAPDQKREKKEHLHGNCQTLSARLRARACDRGHRQAARAAGKRRGPAADRRVGHRAFYRHAGQPVLSAQRGNEAGYPLDLQKDPEIRDHSAGRESQYPHGPDGRALFPDGHGVYARNVLRPWRADRKGTGTELENKQPHQRRHGHLRRFSHCSHRPGHRRDGSGHCLRHVGDVPVRYGHDPCLPAARPLAGAVGRGVRPLGRNGGQRYLQRRRHRLCLQ